MTADTQKLEIIQLILSLQDTHVLAKIEQILKKQPNQTNGSQSYSPKESESFRPFGFAKGIITYVAPDFDETPSGFEEYMQ